MEGKESWSAREREIASPTMPTTPWINLGDASRERNLREKREDGGGVKITHATLQSILDLGIRLLHFAFSLLRKDHF